jgi:RNA polymerase-binding transcription factor DksA
MERPVEKPLSAQEILRYKKRLLEDFASHAGEVEGVERGALAPSGGTRFQDVDESVGETALSSDLEVLRVEDDLGYEVHEALERIERSTFGVCEDCGQTIARERLDLVPYARLCAGCAGAPRR